MITNLRATLFVQNYETNSDVQLGIAKDDSWYFAGYDSEIRLIWTDALSALALIEKYRNGKPPQFRIEFRAETCWLLDHIDMQGRHRIRALPQYTGGNAKVTYPMETWIKMLRELKIAENILVEIPLPGVPPAPWDKVWNALVEARNAFDQGGSTGWKGCVTAVRLALEEWQKIEKEDMGPGWAAPSHNDLRNRTMQQRVDNLRWHLVQLAHLGAHSGAENWSRDDALLMLSTLSALLSVRKP